MARAAGRDHRRVPARRRARDVRALRADPRLADDLGVDRVTLLVIPAPDLHPFDDRRPELADWLDERARAGDAIAQHGFQHRRPHAGRGRRSGGAEFVGLDDDETRRAVLAGRRVLKLAGIQPRGFVAPAYAYTHALRETLARPSTGGRASAACTAPAAARPACPRLASGRRRARSAGPRRGSSAPAPAVGPAAAPGPPSGRPGPSALRGRGRARPARCPRSPRGHLRRARGGELIRRGASLYARRASRLAREAAPHDVPVVLRRRSAPARRRIVFAGVVHVGQMPLSVPTTAPQGGGRAGGSTPATVDSDGLYCEALRRPCPSRAVDLPGSWTAAPTHDGAADCERREAARQREAKRRPAARAAPGRTALGTQRFSRRLSTANGLLVSVSSAGAWRVSRAHRGRSAPRSSASMARRATRCASSASTRPTAAVVRRRWE